MTRRGCKSGSYKKNTHKRTLFKEAERVYPRSVGAAQTYSSGPKAQDRPVSGGIPGGQPASRTSPKVKSLVAKGDTGKRSEGQNNASTTECDSGARSTDGSIDGSPGCSRRVQSDAGRYIGAGGATHYSSSTSTVTTYWFPGSAQGTDSPKRPWQVQVAAGTSSYPAA